MSRELRDFSKFFMQGLQMGAGWAEKRQAQAIAQARNEMLAKQNAAKEARENRRLDLYGESVKANAELARARAQKALTGGGKGGAAAAAPSYADTLLENARKQGIITAPETPPAAPTTNVIVQGSDDGPDPQPVEPPAMESGEVQTEAKGGMVRKMARGGFAESFGNSFSAASKKYSDLREKREAAAKPAATPAPAAATGPPTAITPTTPPDMSGTAETYRRGGRVRNFASGGRVMETAIDTGTSGPGSGYGDRAAPPYRSY